MAGAEQIAASDFSAMVDAAVGRYVFHRRRRDRVLVRQPRGGLVGGTERLVDGHWVDVGTPRRLDVETTWERLSKKQLQTHARRYLIADLGAPGIGWQGANFSKRVRRGALARWIDPPLRGGARRRQIIKVARRQRALDLERLRSATALVELEAAALHGFEHQRERSRGVEQRANFFLGAAGLTTSLVLANAGLQLDSEKLGEGSLLAAAVALGFASVCTIIAGLRALQATMTTFTRLPPDNVPRLDERLSIPKEEQRRARIAALLVAQYRTSAIADWKLARLKSARSSFVLAIVGIVVLTGIVLIETV